MVEGSNSAQTRVFKDTLILFPMYLHTYAIKLLYKLCGDVLISRLVSFCIAYLVSVCACLAFCCEKIRKVCPAKFN